MAASMRYLGQKILASVGRRRCVHCDLMNSHVAGCPALLQLAQPVQSRAERSPCPDPECATTKDEHTKDCAVDMGADSMHKPALPGAREGVW